MDEGNKLFRAPRLVIKLDTYCYCYYYCDDDEDKLFDQLIVDENGIIM